MDGASHMLYVDDITGKGGHLVGSGATITITNGERTERFIMDDEEAEEESRYGLSHMVYFMFSFFLSIVQVLASWLSHNE